MVECSKRKINRCTTEKTENRCQKDKTGATLMSLKMLEGNDLPHELLLTPRQ